MDASKKRKYDWDTIEKEYRTNQFSDSELARRHGCSRTAIQKRSKKENWSRDLSHQVRETANAKLVAEDAKVAAEVAGRNVEGERSEIELASETRVAVLRSHRKDIRRLQEVEASLIEDLSNDPKLTKVFSYQGEIHSQDFDVCVTDKCQALNNLANVQHKRVQLERQAFNLDDVSEGSDIKALADLVRDLDGNTKGPTGTDDSSN